MTMDAVKNTILPAGAILLALLSLMALVRAILGPRFTDRVVAVNMINTMVVAVICILSVWMREDFLVDVALVYALLSFLTVVVLTRMVLVRQRRRQQRRPCADMKSEKGDAAHGK